MTHWSSIDRGVGEYFSICFRRVFSVWGSSFIDRALLRPFSTAGFALSADGLMGIAAVVSLIIIKWGSWHLHVVPWTMWSHSGSSLFLLFGQHNSSKLTQSSKMIYFLCWLTLILPNFFFNLFSMFYRICSTLIMLIFIFLWILGCCTEIRPNYRQWSETGLWSKGAQVSLSDIVFLVNI